MRIVRGGELIYMLLQEVLFTGFYSQGYCFYYRVTVSITGFYLSGHRCKHNVDSDVEAGVDSSVDTSMYSDVDTGVEKNRACRFSPLR
jgi:hypothetical protein